MQSMQETFSALKKKYHERGKFSSRNRVMLITLSRQQKVTKVIAMRRLFFAVLAVLALSGAMTAYTGPASALPPDPCRHQ